MSNGYDPGMFVDPATEAQFGSSAGTDGIGSLFSASGLSSAMQTGGSVYGAFTGAKVSKWNARALSQTAQAAASLIPNVRAEAGMRSRRIRERGMAVTGQQRAGAAAMGVDPSQGSPVLVMLDTIRKASEDAWLARYKGDVAAWELSERARQLKAQSGLMAWEGKQEEIGAYIQAGSSILGGLLGLAGGGMA